MGIHSKILVHWTGKRDIENEPEARRAQLYLERLRDYYQNGLFAKRTSEDVIRGMRMANIIRLCFTEIRLSQVQAHSDRYGKLGLGFARDFITNKGGRPVVYIPYNASEDSRLLEDSIKNVYERSQDNTGIHRSAKWIMAHVKRMSNENNDEIAGYEDYYEEMEWRIVYDENPENRHLTQGQGKGIRRLKFEASDIRVLVFPDEDTRRISLEDDILKRYLSEHMPIMATLADCPDF